MLDKLKSSFKHSVTILWARVVIAAGVAMSAAVNLTADPNTSTAIQSLFPPKYVPYYLIAIGIITELARRRTAGKN